MNQRTPHRRGSVYIMVLGVSLLVTVMGVGSLLAARSSARAAETGTETEQAQQSARAAVEFGLYYIRNNPNWRDLKTSGSWSNKTVFAEGAINFALVDEVDGVLNNNDTDPVRVYGRGEYGGSVRLMSVELITSATGYQALGFPLHTASDFSFPTATHQGAPAVLTVEGGPLSSAGTVTNLGTITGAVEAVAYTGAGNVSAGVQLDPLKATTTMPPAAVFDFYLDVENATTIPWNTTNFPYNSGKGRYDVGFDVLTPSGSSTGGVIPNPNGLYYVEVPAGVKLQVDRCRIRGTILFQGGVGTTIHFGGQILWEPARADYPMSIIRGATSVELDSRGTDGLSEPNLAKNFNPPGFPYLSVTDADQTDLYPSDLNGLIHVIGASCTTTLFDAVESNGAIICEGPVTFPGGKQGTRARLVHDPSLVSSPPLGYGSSAVTLREDSWRREPGP